MPKIESDDTAVTLTYDDNDIKEILDYWTEERVKSAEPLELPSVSEEEFQKIIGSPDLSTRPEPEEAESSDPSSLVEGKVTQANVGERPFWNGGKFLFTKTDGKRYYCTSEFVANNHILLTAGHCVQNGDTGKMNTNFIFYRANTGGTSGQKVSIKTVKVSPNWAQPKNAAFDYAFMKTITQSGAGWLGYYTGMPFKNWTAIGYPGNFFGGQQMSRVDGSLGTIQSGIVQMKNNPMTQGASGGAWIGDLTIPHVGGNYAIGLNSFFRTDVPSSMYGPYFDGKFVQLYQEALNS